MSVNRCLVPILAVLLLAAFGLDGLAQTRTHTATVKYKDRRGRDKEESLPVITHTFRGLEYKAGRTTRTLGNDQIVSIKYQRVPDGYADAIALALDDPGGCIDAFEEYLADENALRRSGWTLQEALYTMWQCARSLGRHDVATGYADRLKKEVKDSRYVPNLKLARGYELLALGQDNAAAKSFNVLRKEVTSKKYAPGFAVDAAVGEVESLVSGGKAADARKVLGEIMGSNPTGRAKRLADVMQGRILYAEKKYQAARTQFQKLLDVAKKDDHSVIAAASVGKGDCNFAEQNFDKALYDYSVAPALFHADPELEYHVGWAMFRWAKTYQRLSNAIEDPQSEQKKIYGARYRKLRKRAAEDYPLSRGGQLARKELGL